MLKISAIMAMLYGLGLAGFETLVNWGQWQWWPWWLVDYVAAGWLFVGGALILSGKTPGQHIMNSGWGFALGMMWMSLAGNLAEGTDPDRAARVAGLYVALIGLSMVYCLAGFALSVFAKEQSTSSR